MRASSSVLRPSLSASARSSASARRARAIDAGRDGIAREDARDVGGRDARAHALRRGDQAADGQGVLQGQGVSTRESDDGRRHRTGVRDIRRRGGTRERAGARARRVLHVGGVRVDEVRLQATAGDGDGLH